jgi:hypothetical protein
MASVIRCDQCGKDAQQPIGWYRVEQFGVVSVNQPRPPSPREFCSLECLALWAAQQAEQNALTKFVEVHGISR